MNRFIPPDSVMDLRINKINSLLNNADKLCAPQNEVFEWRFWLKKHIVEHDNKDLSPLWIDLNKFWKVCDLDGICSEHSGWSFMLWNFVHIRGLWFLLLWLQFGAFELLMGCVWQGLCRIITFWLGNHSNILWRIWSTSADRSSNLTYLIFTWKVSLTIKLDLLWQLCSLEFWLLCRSIQVFEPTKGWLKSLSTLLCRFQVSLSIWDGTRCSFICLGPYESHIRTG